MAGGTFLTQNKIRAGVYINFKSRDTAGTVPGERGIAAIPLRLGFGGKLTRVTGDSDIKALFGYRADKEELLLLRECAKRAREVLVYRLNDGEKAKASLGNLTAEARYGGIRGNDFMVSVTEEGEVFRVETLLDGERLDSQLTADIGGLKDNSWVVFSGSGALSAQQARLSGGTGEEVADADAYEGYWKALEGAEFQTFAVPCEETAVKAAAVSFVKRMREEEGRPIQAVVAGYPQADYEGVISVKNGVVLEEGRILSPEEATAYTAGMTAGAQVNQSNTYGAYDGAVDVAERYGSAGITAAIAAGEWVFVPKNGKVVVEEDCNSFTSFTVEKGKIFSKNRPLRVMDTLAADIRRLFEEKYLGKTGNSADGRSLFRAELTGYLEEMAGLGAIDSFDGQKDVEVLPGALAEAVVVNLAIQPVDSMEKLYMTVEV